MLSEAYRQYKKIKDKTTFNNGSTKRKVTITTQFAVCEECLEHERKVQSKVESVMGISVLIGLIVTLAVVVFLKVKGIDFEGTNNIWFIGSGIPVAMILYCIIAAMVKVPTVGEGHSTNGESAFIRGYKRRGDIIIFGFSNREFAEEFADKNCLTMKFKKATGKENAKTVLQADKNLLKTFVGIFCVIFTVITIAVVIYALIFNLIN